VKVALGKFACACIEARFGPDVAAGVQEAIRAYRTNLDSADTLLPFPRFLLDRPSPAGRVEIELSVASDVQTTLEREARRQGVCMDELLTHLVFIHLAAA
jgi:hypothetical protein